jgi:hypothetical protein
MSDGDGTIMTDRGDLPDYGSVVLDLCWDARQHKLSHDELRALVWAIAECAETAQVSIVWPGSVIVDGLRGLAGRGLLSVRDSDMGGVEVQMLPPDHAYWRREVAR